MKIFQTQAWADVEQHYRRMLLAAWIALVVAAFLTVAAADSVIMSYVLEELTTHSIDGLILKHYALPTSEEYPLFMTHILASSAFVGLMAGILARIALPHWRAWVLMLVLAGLPYIVGSLLALFWREKAPHLFAWGVRQIMMIATAHMVAAVVGTLLGRLAGKILVRMIVPPRWRAFLSQPPGAPPTGAAPPPDRPHYWTERIGPTRR